MLTHLIATGIVGSGPVAPPDDTGEPVTRAEIKQHLDVARSDQDEMLQGMIVAAREWVENYTGLILTRREVTVGLHRLTARTELTVWPIAAGSQVSIGYTDTTGQPQTIATARLVATLRPARIYPALDTFWPSTIEPVAVTVLAGYPDPASVPFSLKAAIKLLVGDMYSQREETAIGVSVQASGAIESLCDPYRMPGIA